jgi:hypothetical protein
MSKSISKRENEVQITRLCDECGKVIEKDDIWYPFIDISKCGGGILYLHSRCAVGRVVDNISKDKEDLLERVEEAEKQKDDLLSDGLMNFYWGFPISPIYWVKYAMNNDFKEIKELVEEIERRDKGETAKQEESVKMKKKQK